MKLVEESSEVPAWKECGKGSHMPKRENTKPAHPAQPAQRASTASHGDRVLGKTPKAQGFCLLMLAVGLAPGERGYHPYGKVK